MTALPSCPAGKIPNCSAVGCGPCVCPAGQIECPSVPGTCKAPVYCSDITRETASSCTGACGVCKSGYIADPNNLTGPCIAPTPVYENFSNAGNISNTGTLINNGSLKVIGSAAFGTFNPDSNWKLSVDNFYAGNGTLGVVIGAGSIGTGLTQDAGSMKIDNILRVGGSVGIGMDPASNYKVAIDGSSGSVRGLYASGTDLGIYASSMSSTGQALYTNQSNPTGYSIYAAGGKNYFEGSVGLGINSPVEKLDVNGAVKLGTTTSANAGTIRWNGTDFQGYNGSAWKSLTGGGAVYTGAANQIAIDSSNKISFVASPVISDSLTVAGNIGVGTTTPGAKLDVYGAGLFSWAGGSNGTVYLGDTNHGIKATTGSGVTIFSYGVPSGIYLQQATGNVGIGTTNPKGRLSLNSNGDGIVWGNGPYSKIYDNADLHIWTDDNLHFDNTGGERMTMLSNGNVGIGTTIPSANLDVNGYIKTGYGTNLPGYGIMAKGTTAAGLFESTGGYAVYGTSDRWGVYGKGVYGGASFEGTGPGVKGVYGLSSGGMGYGVFGENTGASGYGVYGKADSSGSAGVRGDSASGYGVIGQAAGSGAGVQARNAGSGPSLELGSGWLKISEPTVGKASNTTATGFWYPVSNSNVTANSIIIATIQNGSGSTGVKDKATGSFSLYVPANATVAYLVINK